MKLLTSSMFALLLANSACTTTYFPARAGTFFTMQDNCNGCAVGDPTPINTAVVEYVLSRPGTKIREHYEVMGVQAKNGTIQQAGMYGTEFALLLEEQKAFIHEAATKAGVDVNDPAKLNEFLANGEVMSRAVARLTAAATAEAIKNEGRAQWWWAAEWEKNEQGTFEPAGYMGFFTLVVGRQAENKVEVYLYGSDQDPTTPVLAFDTSGVKGAFDASASLAFDDVAASIKPIALAQ